LETERAQVEDGPLYPIKGFAAKSPEHACRIAGCLAVYENGPGAIITADHYRRAAKIVRWFINEHLRLLGEAAATTEQRQAETIRQWLFTSWKQCDYFSITELKQRGPNVLRTLSPDDYRKRIATLIRNKLVAGPVWNQKTVTMPDGTIERRREVYRIIRSAK